MCLYITDHFAVHLKLTRPCKSLYSSENKNTNYSDVLSRPEYGPLSKHLRDTTSGLPLPHHIAPQDSPTLLGLGRRVFAPWDVDFEHENRKLDKS